MKKITISSVIKFRQKTPKSKKGFLNQLIKKQEQKGTGGGNYWIRSLSALSESVSLLNNDPIKLKIKEISDLIVPTLNKKTKDMYDRNLKILNSYKRVDFASWLPKNAKILPKTTNHTIIEYSGLPLQISPHQVFMYKKETKKCIGAIWFVVNINGFKPQELGMFADGLKIYLDNNYGEYEVIPESCIIADVIAHKQVTYKMILDGVIDSVLDDTLAEIKSLI